MKELQGLFAPLLFAFWPRHTTPRMDSFVNKIIRVPSKRHLITNAIHRPVTWLAPICGLHTLSLKAVTVSTATKANKGLSIHHVA